MAATGDIDQRTKVGGLGMVKKVRGKARSGELVCVEFISDV